jgi:hypothetical protein
MLYDKEPSKISKELTERDNIGNDDFFVLFLNGYNDKQQSLELFVTAAGVQADSKITNENGEDFSWNGIWYSAAKIVENGWTVEMKIPFSELRFPKSEVQNWGLNFFRQINRTKTAYTGITLTTKKVVSYYMTEFWKTSKILIRQFVCLLCPIFLLMSIIMMGKLQPISMEEWM